MVDFTKRSKKANCLTIRYQKELSKLWTIESYKKRRLHRGQQLRQPDIELKSRGSRSHTQVGITLLSRFWWGAAASGFAEELARGSFVMMGVNSVIHPSLSLPFCTMYHHWLSTGKSSFTPRCGGEWTLPRPLKNAKKLQLALLVPYTTQRWRARLLLLCWVVAIEQLGAQQQLLLDAFDSCVYRTHAYNGLRTNSPALWSWELKLESAKANVSYTVAEPRRTA